VYCAECGAANEPSSAYCVRCGAHLMPAVKTPQQVVRRPKHLLWVAAVGVLAIILGAFAIWRTRGRAAPPRAQTVGTATLVPTRQPGTGWDEPLTDVQYLQLAALAQDVSFPSARPPLTDTLTVAELLSEPSRVNGKTVRMTGQVTRRTMVCNLQPNMPSALLLVIDDGSAAMPVLYQGAAEGIEVGHAIEVTGVFLAQGKGIHADVARPLDADRTDGGLLDPLMRLPFPVFVLAGAAALLFDLTVFWLVLRRRHAAHRLSRPISETHGRDA
jgi:hypothetical protein